MPAASEEASRSRRSGPDPATGVLVTGGTGKVGRELVGLLRAAGAQVRVAGRTPDAGDPDAVRFDWHDPSTHAAALRGRDRVFLMPPTRSADPLPPVLPFLAEARRLGVRRLVLLGSALPLSPGADALAAQVRAWPGWVVLRASGFMQNFLSPYPLGERIRRDGEIRTASGDGRVGWIDLRDIAATAAAALLTDRNTPAAEGDYVLTGPQALSYREAAAIITAATGRPIRVVHTDVDQQAADLRAAGVPAPFATILARLDAGAATGRYGEVSSAVPDLTGRPPRAFAEFVQEHAARWSAPGTR